MQPRAILFDKDGTLVDFFAMWVPAYLDGARALAERAGDSGLAARVLERTGFDHERQRFDADSVLAAGTTDAVVATWIAAAGFSRASDADAASDALRAIFHHHATRAPRPVTGSKAELRALLTRLRERGLALGVATMDTTDAATGGLAALGIDGLLDFVVGCDAGHGVKPEPGMVVAFARAMDLAPSQVLVIGDSATDLAMGRAAGAHACVGVLSGISRRHQLEPQAHAIIESVAGLEALLS